MNRNEQKTENTWDLSALVRNGEEWDKSMKKLAAAFRKWGDLQGVYTKPAR